MRFADSGGLHMGGENLQQHRRLRALGGFCCELEGQRNQPVSKGKRNVASEFRPDGRTSAAQLVAVANVIMDK